MFSSESRPSLWFRNRNSREGNADISAIKEVAFLGNQTMQFYRSEYWANRRQYLTDGTYIKQGQQIGRIDIIPTPIQPGERFVEYTKGLKADVQEGLHILAQKCEDEEPLVDGLTIFGGYSRLANIGARYHFEVHEIQNAELQDHLVRTTKIEAQRAVGENIVWQTISKKLIIPKQALISRNQLITHYGKKSTGLAREKKLTQHAQ